MKRMPKIYLDEFLKQQAMLIKSRLQLAALLFIFCILAGDIIDIFTLNAKIDPHMKITWMFVIGVSAVTLILSQKIFTFNMAKVFAALFMIMALVVMARDSIAYRLPPFEGAMIFIFMFFGFSLIFPWSAIEIVGVSFFHFMAYGIFVSNVSEFSYKNAMVARDLTDYLGGLVIMFLASVVCFIVIKRERQRDAENFVLLKEIEDKNKQMQNELELATRVHSRLIPRSISTYLADIAVTYVPMYYMGGDYAKFYFTDKNKLIFIICDVTGHGVSAALLVNALNSEFERLVKEKKSPGTLLKELDKFIKNDFAGISMYLTAFCGLLDYSHFSRKFTYSSYGHPPQYIYRTAKSEVEKISAQTSFLGLPIEDENIYENEIPFNKKDQILLFTDGVIEAKDSEGKDYGSKKLESFIRKNNNLQTGSFNQELLNELNSFTRNNLKDDIFILNIKTK